MGVTPHGIERDCRLEPREIHPGAHVSGQYNLSSTPPVSRRDLSNRVLGYFQWRRLDGLARWFGREFHRLFREWIDAAASFRGGLMDHRHFDEARNDKLTGFVQLFVANRRQVFHDSLHVCFRNLRSVRNCIDQLILGHLGHDGFPCGGSEQFQARGVRHSV